MAASGSGRVTRLLRIDRTVASLPAAIGFYCQGLSFELVQPEAEMEPVMAAALGSGPGRSARLRLGKQEIGLTCFEAPGAPYPADSTAADLWFQHIAVVTSDIEAAYDRLRRYAPIAISDNGPVELPPEAGGVSAYKFRDPDGHPLELIQFPAGAGDPAWQSRSQAQATLGIDHSAISISDMGQSLHFYRDVLGMQVAAQQINRGKAQRQLDDLAEDVVDVVALQPSRQHTPHIELLGYRQPRGCAQASLLRPCDIAADRLVVEVDDVHPLFARIGPRMLQREDGMALIHDPDGHMLLVTDGAAASPNSAVRR